MSQITQINRTQKAFLSLKKEKGKALVAFVTAGDPSLSATEKIIYELENNGVDIIEIGVPFSDPLADGPTIQRASMRALKNKVTLKKVLQLVDKIRTKVKVPLLVMTSINVINKYGYKVFAKDAAKAGLDGVILPDLPPEEASSLKSELKKYRIDLVFLAAPTSTEDRIKLIAKNSSGFVYLISSLGVTGVRRDISFSFQKVLSRIRKYTKLPVVIGFGISSPQQAEKVGKLADGVVVGSSIVNIIEKNAKSPLLYNRVGQFIKNLKKVL